VSIQASKIPRSKNSSPWTLVPGSSDYEWTRGEGRNKQTWRVNVFFRRLDRRTFAFQDIYVNTKLSRNVDPNDKDYHAAYNKWILQIARRQDATYTSDVARVHWIAAERRALNTAINTFCVKFGIHSFGFAAECKLSTEQLQIMADAVNAVPNPSRLEPRGIDAVRSQITSDHNNSHPKNREIFNLLAKGIDFHARMSDGEEIPGIEQKSKAAISLSAFPVDTAVTATATLTPDSKKRKQTAFAEETEPSSSELSSPAVSGLGEDWSLEPGEMEVKEFPPWKKARRACRPNR